MVAVAGSKLEVGTEVTGEILRVRSRGAVDASAECKAYLVGVSALLSRAGAAGACSTRTVTTWPVIDDASTRRLTSATCSGSSRLDAGSMPNAADRIGVRVRCGLTQLIRTPLAVHSSASAWVRFTTAALLAE